MVLRSDFESSNLVKPKPEEISNNDTKTDVSQYTFVAKAPKATQKEQFPVSKQDDLQLFNKGTWNIALSRGEIDENLYQKLEAIPVYSIFRTGNALKHHCNEEF